jgi:hypothetical protein
MEGLPPHWMLRLALLGMADSFYAAVPQPDWFKHYLKRFNTGEISAYS